MTYSRLDRWRHQRLWKASTDRPPASADLFSALAGWRLHDNWSTPPTAVLIRDDEANMRMSTAPRHNRW